MTSPLEADRPIEISMEKKVGGDAKTVRRLRVLLRWLVVAAFAVGLLAAWHLAAAATLEGWVVAVADGDTLTVLHASKKQHRICLDPCRKCVCGMSKPAMFLNSSVARCPVLPLPPLE